ncbi:MAG: MFS transporter [Caulobacteraceae bacterium]|nr:MFS transporter [Caulobacteraceae bacterium]
MADLATTGGAGTADAPRHISRGQITAAVIGNALEFYDFTTYSVFAVDIGQAFFPSHTPFVRLMLSLMTFGVGFLTRPVGALVIGAFADRVGRRPAMLLSFGLMGVGIVGLAATPGYAAIGVAAPVLAVLFRMIQGFALGGELGPVMAFLIEASPPNRRGFVGSWQSASQSVASLVGGAVGLGLAAVLSPHLLAAYGWRAAFWLGALVLPFGLIIRRALPETLHHHETPSSAHPESAAILAHSRVLILGVGVIMCFTTSTYVRLYLTTYATTTLHIAAGAAYGASVVNGAAGIVFTLLGGWLSDRHGRKPAMIWPLAAYLAAIYPAFFLIVRNHDPATLWIATGVISALSSMSTGAALIWLSEALRKEIRSAATGGVYAITVATFGGVTQPLIAWLIEATHQPLAPAYYLMATTLVGLAAMVSMIETAPVRLAKRPA